MMIGLALGAEEAQLQRSSISTVDFQLVRTCSKVRSQMIYGVQCCCTFTSPL